MCLVVTQDIVLIVHKKLCLFAPTQIQVQETFTLIAVRRHSVTVVCVTRYVIKNVHACKYNTFNH